MWVPQKKESIRSQESGYADSNAVLCPNCIGNQTIKEYIKASGSIGTCKYCGNKKKSLPLEEFMPLIMSRIAFKYYHRRGTKELL